MKLQSIQITDNGRYEDVKTAVISTLVTYGKLYELLHKQLWRKGRVRLVDSVINHEGRDAKAIRLWNIKSPDPSAYDHDAHDALGLNQLFMGQSPYDVYDGNLKDGIYHDDCYIQPKKSDLPTVPRMGWWIDHNGTFPRTDKWNREVISNVTVYEKFKTVHHDAVEDDPDTEEDESADAYDEEVSEGWFYTVSYTNGSEAEYQVQSYTVESDGDGGESTVVTPHSAVYTDLSVPPVNGEDRDICIQAVELPNMNGHGSLVHEETTSIRVMPRGWTGGVWDFIATEAEALIRVYTDGTAIEITSALQYTSTHDGTDTLYNVPGTLAYLPLVYLDTGDLVQNRVDFIENWDAEFELYVHEDSYWYTPIIQIVIIVVMMVVSLVSTGWLSHTALTVGKEAMALMAGFISGIGAVSGNKMMQMFGALLSFATTTWIEAANETYVKAMEQGFSSRTAMQITSEASFGTLFAEYVSNIGLSNLASIGSSVFGMYGILVAPEEAGNIPSDEIDEDKGMTITVANSDDDDNDVDKELAEMLSIN